MKETNIILIKLRTKRELAKQAVEVRSWRLEDKQKTGQVERDSMDSGGEGNPRLGTDRRPGEGALTGAGH